MGLEPGLTGRGNPANADCSAASGFSFGALLERPDSRNTMPGPGAYDTAEFNTRRLRGPAFSLRGKRKDEGGASVADLPGPGR